MIDVSQARAIVDAVEGRAETVAVFADEALDAISATVDAIHCSVVQLHGSQSPGEVDAVAAKTTLPIIRALRMRNPDTANEFRQYRADYFLADSYDDRAMGGTGVTFDWSMLRGRKPDPLLVSGGLNPDNVSDAIRTIRPFGVDVSSCVEGVVRQKDRAKLEAFFSAVKEAP